MYSPLSIATIAFSLSAGRIRMQVIVFQFQKGSSFFVCDEDHRNFILKAGVCCPDTHKPDWVCDSQEEMQDYWPRGELGSDEDPWGPQDPPSNSTNVRGSSQLQPNFYTWLGSVHHMTKCNCKVHNNNHHTLPEEPEKAWMSSETLLLLGGKRSIWVGFILSCIALMRFKTGFSIVKPDNFIRYVVNVDCDDKDNDFKNCSTDGKSETDIDEV